MLSNGKDLLSLSLPPSSLLPALYLCNFSYSSPLILHCRFQFAIVFKAERGSLQVPLHNIDKILETEQNHFAAPIPLSLFTFAGLEFVVENNLYHQISKIQIISFQVPFSLFPSQFFCIPLPSSLPFFISDHVLPSPHPYTTFLPPLSFPHPRVFPLLLFLFPFPNS